MTTRKILLALLALAALVAAVLSIGPPGPGAADVPLDVATIEAPRTTPPEAEDPIPAPTTERLSGTEPPAAPEASEIRSGVALSATRSRPATRTFFGRVVRDEDGTPIAGATAAVRGGGESVTTDADGVFALDVLYLRELLVSAPGRSPLVVDAAEGHEHRGVAATIRLRRGAALLVTLDDRRSERGSPWIHVRVDAGAIDEDPRFGSGGVTLGGPDLRNQVFRAKVDEHGRAVLEGLPVDAPLRVSITEGVSEVQLVAPAVVLRPGEVRELRCSLDSALVTGRVVRERGGAPVRYTKVRLLRDEHRRRSPGTRSYDGSRASRVVSTATSDGEGRFRFAEVPPGAYEVGAETETLGPIPTVAVAVPERTPRVDVTVPVPDLFVDGIVLGPDGPPEGDFRISASTAEIESTTSAYPGDDGTFRLGPLWPGTVRLTVIPEDGSLLAPASLTVEAGSAGVVVRLGRAAVVRGVVRDEATRLPIAGTLLVRLGFAPDWSSAARVGDDGTFVVDGLPPGEVRLAAAAGDRIGRGPTLDLRAGEERSGVEILVRPGATLVVEHFAEAPTVTLKVTAGDHLLGYEFRNPVGSTSFPVPADEDVTVTASVLGAERRRTVRIEAGDRETVSFRFDLEDDAAENRR